MKHGTPPALTFLDGRLQHLESAGLLRHRGKRSDGVDFCSNDYLGLGREGVANLDGDLASGATGSRLISGDHAVHRRLEGLLAQWLGTEAALLFSSGYAANVGAISCLAGQDDLIISDALNHASIIDGARLSRARVEVVGHLDVEAIRGALRRRRGGRAWVVTEGYFSMDADSPDLGTVRNLCDEHDAALVVDEAHALGVLGPMGRGVCAQAQVSPDVLVGTLGKAFGVAGAFVAGCGTLIDWLWNRARSFVFSTGVSPLLAEIARARLQTSLDDPTRRERALTRAAELRTAMARIGVAPRGYGHIIPWLIGDPRRTVALAEALRGDGIHVQAIRPPTVPDGGSRLRWTATARHTSTQIDQAAAAIGRVWDARTSSS